MKNFLFYLLIFLSVFSCKKEEKINSKVENQTIVKNNNDTIFIQQKCAVFLIPEHNLIIKNAQNKGFEKHYKEIDEFGYAKMYLENKGLKVISTNSKFIKFKNLKENFIINTNQENNILKLYLFDINKKPLLTDNRDIENEYKNYFGEKDSLKFSKKEHNVRFIYNVIPCPCAQWSKVNDKNKYSEKFFLIDSKKLTQDAEDFWDGTSLPLIVEAIGVFSENKSIPKDFSPKGDAEREKARIFKYTKIRLVQLGNKKY